MPPKLKFYLCAIFSKFCGFFNFIYKCFEFCVKSFHQAIKFIQSYIVFLFSFLFLFHFLMLYGSEEKIIELLVAKPQIKKSISYPIPVHGILTHDTTWSHLTPCGVYFNEQEEMKRALQCVNSKVYSEEKIDIHTPIPRCFIISSSSPDVVSRENLNFLPVPSLMGMGAVVGYFDTKTETLFVVENYDAASIYRHELQHYFLKLKGGTGGGHHQDIWKKCEPPYYKESDKVKFINKLDQLEKIEE
jgi:hypothetical protein